MPTALLIAGIVQAQSVELQVELMNQIGTDTSRKGDLISGRVVAPAQLQGDIVEGKITESKSGAKLGGQSAFAFSFDTLRHDRTAIAINSQFKSVVNSKGKVNVDEEGRIVRRASGNVAKAAGGTGAGALIGGLVGGGKGAAIGAAAGAATSIAVIQTTADAPNIRFSPGSRVIIDASARDGSSLAALGTSQSARAEARPAAAAPASYGAAAPSAPASEPAAQPQAAQPQSQAASSASPQPEMKTLTSTFIPGDKTIFYDDFTDMSADEAPPHFKVRGSAPELRSAGNIRQLTVTQRGSIFPNITALTKNFTFEAEIKAEATNRAIFTLMFSSKEKQILHLSTTASATFTDLVVSLRAPYQELGRKRVPLGWKDPVKVAMWVQNGRLRVFLNGEKHLDFNQVEMPPLDKVEFAHDFYGANQSIGYRAVRFAESTPDFSQVISSSGRFVTHGIQFDTGSDRIKPESAPVIQSIARGLETNPNLKLLIEGHTDSVGNAAQNMDLSRRRAEAVKAVLVGQFNVDAARLSTAGLGSAKPIDSNDTPQGRSQNRRVELVKQ
jgi:outer membrane protein OmpA-like peptidoglycan-associated protein